LRTLAPERLMFLDESGVTTQMTRSYGRNIGTTPGRHSPCRVTKTGIHCWRVAYTPWVTTTVHQFVALGHGRSVPSKPSGSRPERVRQRTEHLSCYRTSS